jgi:hypothetical protein
VIARLAMAVALEGACVHTPVVVYHPEVIAIVQTDSDKAVQVVADERIADHEAAAVSPTTVAQALIGSGQFLDEDARSLAAPIARHLATMHADEAVRIVGWAADAPRYYYVVIHGGRLRVISYLGAQHTDDYAAVIPSEVVAIATPPPPPTPIAPEAPPDAAPPAVLDAPPAAAPPAPAPARARTVRVSHPPAAGYQPISEAEARKRIADIDSAAQAGLITPVEYRTKRKEILARL